MKHKTSISIEADVYRIAQDMSVKFGYNNFNKLVEDLIRSASQATEIVMLPARAGRPAMRLFVTSHPESPHTRKRQ
jgi:hypothetical protein